VLRTLISFEPKKIRLHQKNCNNNQNSCFNVNFCVSYEGKHIGDKRSALVTLDITDSKLRIKEIRAKINNNSSEQKSEQKTIELRANEINCFKNNDSFFLTVNVSIVKKSL